MHLFCSDELLLLFICQVISDFFVTSWTEAYQAPLFMRFSRQEYWSELLFPSPWALPGSGIQSVSPALEGGFFTTELPGKPSDELENPNQDITMW